MSLVTVTPARERCALDAPEVL